MFHRLLARDFSDPTYFRVHRMLVDTYALQHPDRYCRSAKSFAAHLAGLAGLLEDGGSRAVGDERLRRWLDGPARLDRPTPPDDRGALTIADVACASGPAEHAAAVERWARSTWAAYAPLHHLARRWLAS
jgi:hypothetical protein